MKPYFETVVFIDFEPVSNLVWTIYTIVLENGKSISLTHEHKMPIILSVGEIQEKRADEVSVGETLACMDDRGSM